MLPAYADEITWQDNTENGRIEKNSTDEKQPAEVNDWGSDDFVAKEEPAAERAGKGRRLENLQQASFRRTYTAGEKEEAIDGDGSYGQIEGELNLDWIYERQEEMKAASGSIFSFAKKSSSKKKNTVKGIGITTAKKNIV